MLYAGRVLHAEIGRNGYGEFDMRDVATAISQKLDPADTATSSGGDHGVRMPTRWQALWNRNKMKRARAKRRYSELHARREPHPCPAAMRAAKVLKRRDQATNRDRDGAGGAGSRCDRRFPGSTATWTKRNVGELMLLERRKPSPGRGAWIPSLRSARPPTGSSTALPRTKDG